MQNTRYIEFFDGGTEPRLERLGGKCASLVSMTAAGMPVPPGFAVTTDLYDAFLESAGIKDDIRRLLDGIDPDDVAHVEEVSARIREEICSRPVPQDQLTPRGEDPFVHGRQAYAPDGLPSMSYGDRL